MAELCFVLGRLIPSLQAARPPATPAFQTRPPLCMGRRSDKIKNKKEKNTRARTKVSDGRVFASDQVSNAAAATRHTFLGPQMMRANLSDSRRWYLLVFEDFCSAR
jgi:hypothetical protein